jgi:outer membrane protein TolC
MMRWLALLTLLFAARATAVDVDEPNVVDVLEMVRTTSPVRKTLDAVEKGRAASIDAAEANYLPTLEFNVVATEGFPAGVAQLGGLPGAAFRSGPAAGLVVRQPVWDFGRSAAAVEARRAEALAGRIKELSTIDQEAALALQTFVECAYARESARQWKDMLGDFETIHAQIRAFVRSGQRSLVEETLAVSQVEEAKTQIAYHERREEMLRALLAERLGRSADSIRCPVLGDKTRAPMIAPTKLPLEDNPAMRAAEAETLLWEAEETKAQREFGPQLQAIASYGIMMNRSAEPDTYAIGLGLRVPLFDGGREQRATAMARAQRDIAVARRDAIRAQLRLEALQLRAKAQLEEQRRDRLRAEVRLLRNAFSRARQRYFLLQGQLADLREAVRNLAQRRSALARARYEAHLARAMYLLLTSPAT